MCAKMPASDDTTTTAVAVAIATAQVLLSTMIMDLIYGRLFSYHIQFCIALHWLRIELK